MVLRSAKDYFGPLRHRRVKVQILWAGRAKVNHHLDR